MKTVYISFKWCASALKNQTFISGLKSQF